MSRNSFSDHLLLFGYFLRYGDVMTGEEHQQMLSLCEQLEKEDDIKKFVKLAQKLNDVFRADEIRKFLKILRELNHVTKI